MIEQRRSFVSPMRVSFLLRVVITGLSFGAGLPLLTTPVQAQRKSAATPPPTETARVAHPELMRLEAFFEKELRDKVEDPYRAAGQKLTEVYRAAVDAAFKKATAAGLLDETLALQNEAKRFAEKSSVPETDDAGTNVEVVRLRAYWRTETERLANQRTAALRPVVEAHRGRLQLLERELTRALKLDDAVAVRSRRDSLAEPASAPLVTAPKTVPATPPPALVATTTAASSSRADLYASGCNHCVVYLDGKPVMTASRDGAEMKRVTLRAGDVIAVKLPDRSADNSFWLVAHSTKGEFLFETSEKWMSYLPADPEKWWEVKDLKLQKPSEPAPDNQEYLYMIKKAAAGTPHYRGTQPIHTSVTAGAYMAYLYYVVTKENLVSKKLE